MTDGLTIDAPAAAEPKAAPFPPFHKWDRNFYLVFIAAVAGCLCNEGVAAWLFHQPWWDVFTRHLVGH